MSKFSVFICLAAALVIVSSAPLTEDYDVQNVSFKKSANEQTFHYVISSKTSGTLEGTTSFDNDPHTQKLDVTTAGNNQQFEVAFTDSDLQSVAVVKPISSIESSVGAFFISPILIKNLLG